MKCPLMRIPITTKGAADREKIDECIKEECAWWNETNGNCGVLQLCKSIYYIGTHVAQIEVKMPPHIPAH